MEQKPAPIPQKTETVPKVLQPEVRVATAPLPTVPSSSLPKTEAPPVSKISSLDAIRQKISNGNGGEKKTNQPLNDENLKNAWLLFIQELKDRKNPAWQSFEVAELKIRDQNTFEAIVDNNINQKFLELERNKASDFLKKHLENKLIQLVITLIESEKEKVIYDIPLSSKEQFQKIVEEFPMVKELKDRLRLELDY